MNVKMDEIVRHGGPRSVAVGGSSSLYQITDSREICPWQRIALTMTGYVLPSPGVILEQIDHERARVHEELL
jgi:hypothetical protein